MQPALLITAFGSVRRFGTFDMDYIDASYCTADATHMPPTC
ncbi:hypothetical protein ANO14919_065310 [Xylariales sp. No.14919]|nr:hypothetical protein ANO14919_065310 [Xylariales sp. No.14919]